MECQGLLLLQQPCIHAIHRIIRKGENMTKKDVYISDVIHKTYIEVDRKGTKAAAATAVVMTEKCIAEPDPARYVTCDRPYAYAIVDKDTGLPVFLGTVETV